MMMNGELKTDWRRVCIGIVAYPVYKGVCKLDLKYQFEKYE